MRVVWTAGWKGRGGRRWVKGVSDRGIGNMTSFAVS